MKRHLQIKRKMADHLVNFLLTSGQYVYIEASFPRRQGDFAKISFKGAHSRTSCITFYYHMYGSGIGTLNIYNCGKRLWSMSGNQGNAWKKAQVTVTGMYDVSVTETRLSLSKSPCLGESQKQCVKHSHQCLITFPNTEKRSAVDGVQTLVRVFDTTSQTNTYFRRKRRTKFG